MSDPMRKVWPKGIWYDPDLGDDANDGRTPETPVATPDRVLALAEESTPQTFTVEWNGKEWVEL